MTDTAFNLDITGYRSFDGSMVLTYLDGVLDKMVIEEEDRIVFDVMIHDVKLYEDELNLKKFRKI